MAKIRVRYETIEFDHIDLHVRSLRDNQQFSDDDGVAESLGISSATWPLFGIMWPSGCVLAHYMQDFDVEGKRVLEVGCGIGLTSLLLNHRHTDITATDYHPEAASFMRENTRLNQDADIPFVRTGWADADSGLGLFDLIVGSDLLYESEHVELLAKFINQHAKPECEVILVDPGRGNHARFSKRMVTLGYTQTQASPVSVDFLSAPFKGQILNYKRC